MKFKNLSIVTVALFFSAVIFTSCKDEVKEADTVEMETETIEAEAAEKAEIERRELEAKKEVMEKEARETSIASIATNTEDLFTLTTALESAELTSMLSEPGNYTVFAPSNNAFEKIPKAKLEKLMLPENKEMLRGLLQYHVVAGKITSDQLAEAIKGANGSYKFKTVAGEDLTASMKGDQFIITDATGKKAQVILGNQEASNGIVHVIDAVLMAKK